MPTNVARAVRFLRRQKGWSQTTLGARAGLSRQTISRLERGRLAGLTIGSLERIADALSASVHVQVRWHGEQLDRLMDAAHAAIQQAVAALLVAASWEIRSETSFNHYGDRGRVDLLAFHRTLRILLVVEVKSALGDLQETLGRLDVKVRLAPVLARDLGWNGVATVIPILVIGDSRLARRTIAAHDTLFARFGVRGRSATAWLRRPVAPMPTGLLWFANRPNSHYAVSKRAGPALNRPASRRV